MVDLGDARLIGRIEIDARLSTAPERFQAPKIDHFGVRLSFQAHKLTSRREVLARTVSEQ
jgi:hypothetical protein